VGIEFKGILPVKLIIQKTTNKTKTKNLDSFALTADDRLVEIIFFKTVDREINLNKV